MQYDVGQWKHLTKGTGFVAPPRVERPLPPPLLLPGRAPSSGVRHARQWWYGQTKRLEKTATPAAGRRSGWRISSKMLGGASQIVSIIRVKCNGP